MILKDAMRSLKDGFSRSFFYWLTLFLTTLFIYLFFHIMMSDPDSASLLTSKSDVIATAVTVAVIVICMIAILFANDFFVKQKAKELAVRLVCGATAFQLAVYLLLQTMVLLIIAIPLGIVTGNAMMPVLSRIISSLMGTSFEMKITSDANLMSFSIIGFSVFWILMLNLSFSLRTGAGLMLNNAIMTQGSQAPVLRLRNVPDAVKNVVLTAAWFVPLILFYTAGNGLFIFASISIYALYQLIPSVIVPWIRKINGSSMNNANAQVYRGFVRHDLQVLRMNMILLIVSDVLLASALIIKQSQPVEVMLYLLSFFVMNVLLTLAIVFKYVTEAVGRVRYYEALTQIGYTEKECTSILYTEVFLLFGSLAFSQLLYLANMVLAKGLSTASQGYSTFLLAVPPAVIIICAIVSAAYYKRSIFSNIRRER